MYPAAGFQASPPTCVTDGRMVVDGGWWWMVVVTKKVLRFLSQFCQMKLRWYKIISIWKIRDVIFSNWKKIRFSLRNSIFRDPKRFSNLAENWLRCGSDNINLFGFETFWIPIFPLEKIRFSWEIRFFVILKGSLILLKIDSYEVQTI